jgi:hypothetical protein
VPRVANLGAYDFLPDYNFPNPKGTLISRTRQIQIVEVSVSRSSLHPMMDGKWMDKHLRCLVSVGNVSRFYNFTGRVASDMESVISINIEAPQ